MTSALTPMLAALDAAPAPLAFFLRDDDGGWRTDQLLALIDCTRRVGVPLDIAMIPMATDRVLANTLNDRLQTCRQLLGVHQHGHAHLNHETEGRACEFGVGRSVQAQRDDIELGWLRLNDFFGEQLDPIFTPPWNRCSDATPRLLATMGYKALSRDRPRRALRLQQSLTEHCVDVDWSKVCRLAWSQGHRDPSTALANAIAEAIALQCASVAPAPIGVMLHHADMQEQDRASLSRMLSVLKAHPKVDWKPMRDLATPTEST